MTPTQRAAALRLAEGPRTSGELWGRAVIALLRELAAEPVQDEPVAAELPAPQLLVESAQGFVEGWTRSQVRSAINLALLKRRYAAPQQRKPLTDEQLKQAMSDAGVRVFQPGLWDVLLDAGRAVERAITGEQE